MTNRIKIHSAIAAGTVLASWPVGPNDHGLIERNRLVVEPTCPSALHNRTEHDRMSGQLAGIVRGRSCIEPENLDLGQAANARARSPRRANTIATCEGL
jgi:hypothetical protein